jgi:hypothetical protein
VFRSSNERIAEAAVELGVEDVLLPFICECSVGRCSEIVRLSLLDYEWIRQDARHFLNAPGHEMAARGNVKVIRRGDGFVVVEKLGQAGDVAERLNERQDRRAG